MEAFLIPRSISFLSQFILALLTTLYLLSIRRRSVSTWWLAAALGAHTLFVSLVFIVDASMAGPSALPSAVQFIVFMFALTCHVGFAYTFLGNPYRRESGIVIGVFVLVCVVWAYVLLSSLNIGIMARSGTAEMIGLTLLVMAAWTASVHLRKTVRLSHAGEATTTGLRNLIRPSTRAARAHRAFALLTMAALILPVANSLTHLGVLGVSTMDYILAVGFLLYIFALVVVYVSHSAEPTTFQVKVVGFSLASVLAVLGVMPLVIHNDSDLTLLAEIEAPERSLTFTPDDRGGYHIASTDIPFDPHLGEDLQIPNGGYPSVELGFPFPFAGSEWESVHVDDDGLISFGGGFRILAQFRETRLPMIAPLFASLDPDQGGSVHLRREEGSALITWNEVVHLPTGRPATLQLLLEENGAFSFIYGDVPPTSDGYRGVFPAGMSAPGDIRPLATAGFAPSGTTVADTYEVTFRRAVHARLLPMVWIVLLATAFILIVMPYFLSVSITRPLSSLLSGVRRVNEGDLQTEVPVYVHDEIGHLTENFNRMTQTLRAAEVRLKAYAEDLENRVKERTSELVSTIERLKSAQAQLVQQEKMASLGQLTAGIAHEIKNPLNFVNNFSSLLLELVEELRSDIATASPDVAAEVADILADIETNARKIEEHGRRADGIVRSMLAHSRGGRGERTSADINALLKDYVGLSYHGMRARKPDFSCEVETRLDPELPPVEIIAQDIGRVFLNVLSNALDAVHDRRIRCAEDGYSPRVLVATRLLEDEVRIMISDNGSGIPDDVRQRVFEPFFTTKATGEGTGLGLSMSHDIVRGHGGRIEISSEGEFATTFIITLPLERVTPTREPGPLHRE